MHSPLLTSQIRTLIRTMEWTLTKKIQFIISLGETVTRWSNTIYILTVWSSAADTKELPLGENEHAFKMKKYFISKTYHSMHLAKSGEIYPITPNKETTEKLQHYLNPASMSCQNNVHTPHFNIPQDDCQIPWGRCLKWNWKKYNDTYSKYLLYKHCFIVHH